MRKRLLIALLLLLVLSTYNTNQNLDLLSKFQIKKIHFENNYLLSDSEVENILSFLYEKNLFSITNEDIKKKINNGTFIESFKIKKIYPNQIKVKIFEKKPLVILQNKKKKFYYTNKGDLISFVEKDNFKVLPVVFGDKKNFEFFYNELQAINFPFNMLESLYFFESQRWDLKTKKNQTIKLPIENYHKSLINFLDIKDKDNFAKYKIFDYRISNQLILK